MGALQNFESKLETMISGVFARAFRSAVQPVEISSALQREVDNNAQILSRDRRLVPNDFVVELSQTDLERLTGYDDALERELAEQLKEHANAQAYVFPGKIQIALEEAEDLTTGRFRVRSKAKASVDSRHTQDRQARAFLEVNGSRHALTPPAVTIGRGTEAGVRINDPGISRQHAQFTLATDPDGRLRVAVEDLGSTNGILVDGHRVTRVSVRNGSKVKLGHTEMVVRIEEDA